MPHILKIGANLSLKIRKLGFLAYLLSVYAKKKGIQEQSNTKTRIQCHEINFQNKLNLREYYAKNLIY